IVHIRSPMEICHSCPGRNIAARGTFWIIVIEPAGKVQPIPVVAGMHGAELHVVLSNDVSVNMTWFKLFSSFDAVADRINHAAPQISGLIENDDFRML